MLRNAVLLPSPVAVILAAMLFSPFALGAGAEEDPAGRTIAVNPYADVDWDAFGQYKAALHVHTLQSDGHHELRDVVQAYHDAGFAILAITDHDNMEPNVQVRAGNVPEEDASPYPMPPLPENYPANTTWPWRNFGAPAPDDLGIIGVEAAELTYRHHMNSFFSDYGAESADVSEDAQLAAVLETGGLAILDHPGIDAGWWERKPLDWYVERFETNGPEVLVGMEVTNCPPERELYDEGLWDQLLARFMPERPIWGFGTDDMHDLASVRESHSVFVLGELGEEAVRDAMANGQFYFRKSTRRNDLRERRPADELFPVIEAIDVDEDAGTITIHASNYDAIRWISAPDSLEAVEDYETSNQPWPLGSVVHDGAEVSYRETPGVENYLRAELHREEDGETYRAFTNPFGISSED